LVFGRLSHLGIRPAYLCSDSVFVRRAYLDVIGTLPTSQEAQGFLSDSSPGKRSALIEQLLNRPEFADYWAMKWSDLLRVKSEFPIDLWPNAVQAYYQWIHASIAENKPYDSFVREMLTASGSNFRVPPVNFYRAVQSKDPETIARVVALTFMGARAEKWPAKRLSDMSAFFSQVAYKSTDEWKEEIVFFDPQKGGGVARMATFPDGATVRLSPGVDPREAFADWLTSPRNPWFARAIVNRAWLWLLGRGIIDPPDDIRPDNPATNPQLLAYLEHQLIASHYDLKHIFTLILNSNTYQLSSVARTRQPGGAANFAYYPLRRLDAEVLIDALDQITGTSERYSSAIPEPYTFIPPTHRTIGLPDGSITSSFLDMFGRPSRDTGLESERNNQASADQRLYMLNSSYIQGKLDHSDRLMALARPGDTPAQMITAVYLCVLSRLPTAGELSAAGAYFNSRAVNKRQGIEDLAWALINTSEFLYRH
jgi:hypothetical protein